MALDLAWHMGPDADPPSLGTVPVSMTQNITLGARPGVSLCPLTWIFPEPRHRTLAHGPGPNQPATQEESSGKRPLALE